MEYPKILAPQYFATTITDAKLSIPAMICPAKIRRVSVKVFRAFKI